MKRVGQAELGEIPAPAGTAPKAGDFGAQLAQLLSGLDDIKATQESLKSLASDVSILSARMQTVEKLLSQSAQYQKDHDELHRVMATATGANDAEINKTLALAVTSHQQTMREAVLHQSEQVKDSLAVNLETTRTMITAMVQAIEEATDKDIDVHFPEQNLHVNIPERELLDYDLIRGNNNLLAKIREVKQ